MNFYAVRSTLGKKQSWVYPGKEIWKDSKIKEEGSMFITGIFASENEESLRNKLEMQDGIVKEGSKQRWDLDSIRQISEEEAGRAWMYGMFQEEYGDNLNGAKAIWLGTRSSFLFKDGKVITINDYDEEGFGEVN